MNGAQVADDWTRGSLAIEAQLRAYFPQRIVTAWEIYTWTMDRFVAGYRGQAQAALYAAARTLEAPHSFQIEGGLYEFDAPIEKWQPQPKLLDPEAAFAAAGVFNASGRGPGGPSFKLVRTFEQEARDAIWTELRPDLEAGSNNRFDIGKGGEPYSEPGQLDFVQEALVEFQAELTREVLAAHATGFSTSTRDLLKDLLP